MNEQKESHGEWRGWSRAGKPQWWGGCWTLKERGSWGFGSNIPPFVKPVCSAEDQGKPVPYSYKMWTISTLEELWGQTLLREGHSDWDQGVRQGPNVVLDLVARAGTIEGSHVYFDNLFHLPFPCWSSCLIWGTGTVCQNRLIKVPIKGKEKLQKKAVPRGTADILYQADQVLVVRKDS